MNTQATAAGSPTATDLSRRRRARADAQRHSQRVRRLKVILPAIVGLIVAVIGAMVAVSALAPGIDLSSLRLGSDGIVMANPRLSGHDAENRSYEVTAERAVQSLANPKVITLEDIRARIELGDGSWATFKAVKGVFDGDREHLSLTGNINIDSSLGYKAKLDGADIDIRGGAVNSAEPIELVSDRGTIRAGRLAVREEGRTIVFGDGVKMTLIPGGEKAVPTPATARPAKENP